MIVVVVQHPILGALLVPYIAEDQEQDTILLVEQAFHASPEILARMNEPERQIIKIAARYTEKELMKAYPKEKNVSQFIKKLTEADVKRPIRPRIEPQMEQIVELIFTLHIPLYLNLAGNKLLYLHNTISLSPYTTIVHFHYMLEDEFLTYSYSCE